MVCHKHLTAFIEIITKLLSLKFCYFFIFRVQLEYSGEYVIWPEFLIIWSLDCVCTRVDNLRFKGHRRKEKAEKTLRFLVNFVFLKHGNASRSLIMLTIEWLLLWSDYNHISVTLKSFIHTRIFSIREIPRLPNFIFCHFSVTADSSFTKI